jgi:hypothetical protein
MQNGMQLSADNTTNMKDKKEKAKANALANINVVEVSFMIFRTGSVLIVGMCEENVLNDIYGFLTKLLKTEFEHICQSLIGSSHAILKDKKKKVRRKVVMITTTSDQDLTSDQNALANKKQNLNSSASKIEFDIVDDLELDLEAKPEPIVEKKVKRSYNKKKV